MRKCERPRYSLVARPGRPISKCAPIVITRCSTFFNLAFSDFSSLLALVACLFNVFAVNCARLR